MVPQEAWTFDPTHPRARPALSADAAASLSQQIAQLQLERTALRARIAQEGDAWKRQALYEELHAVGLRLSPLERITGNYASAR